MSAGTAAGAGPLSSDAAGSTAFSLVATRTLLRARSTVRVDTIRDADGSTFEREVVQHDDAVAMVAVDDRGRVAMVRQYRHATGTTLLEIPAGTLDVPGEDPDAAARRELAEEVGLAAEVLRPIGTVWNSSGWCDERTTIFLATGLRGVGAPPGYEARAEEAAMTVEWHELDTLHRAALDGSLTDAKTIIGLVRARAVLRGEDGNRPQG